MSENIKHIPGFAGKYSITDDGRVYSHPRIEERDGRDGAVSYLVKGRWMKQQLRNGYLRVCLSGKHYSVHRLVAESFIPNPDGKSYINHRDGNKSNNLISNLEWCTAKENSDHKFATGLHTPLKGERHNNAKLSESEVAEIRGSDEPVGALAYRYCVNRTCIYKIKSGKTWSHI